MEKRDLPDVLGAVGGLICIIAGVYLFRSQTQDSSSYLMTIAHGAGLYFVGKGLFVLQSTARQSSQDGVLRRIHAELGGSERSVEVTKYRGKSERSVEDTKYRGKNVPEEWRRPGGSADGPVRPF